MAPYIPPPLLPNLKLYKYSAVDKSLLSKFVLQPYWTWLVRLFPLWLAPNLITLLGLLCIGVNVGTLLFYSPTLATPCPDWVYWSFAVGLWTYQSLDAIDGKQARRTGTGSPLGQLFDHGCDALNTSFGVLLVASALDIGQSWLALLGFVSSTTMFYLATWEEFHTGTLYLGYINGPVEGVVMTVLVYAWSGLKGAAWWSQTVGSVVQVAWLPEWLSAIKLNEAFAVPCLLLIAGNLIISLSNMSAECRRKNVSVVTTLPGLVPYLVLVCSLYGWVMASPHLLVSHVAAIFLAFGVCMGNLVGRMIVAHVTHDQFPYFNYSLVPLVFGAVQAQLRYHNVFTGRSWMTPRQETMLLYAALAYVVAVHVHFVLGVIGEICQYLDIDCLTIKPPPPAADQKKKTK